MIFAETTAVAARNSFHLSLPCSVGPALFLFVIIIIYTLKRFSAYVGRDYVNRNVVVLQLT